MGKKIIPIVLFIVLGYFLFQMRGCFFEAGEKATPDINSNTKQILRIIPTFVRLPSGVNLERYTHNMTAIYESHVSDCAVHLSGSGSLDFPKYEVEMQGDIRNGFVLWKDLALPDKCKWKFTGVDYRIKLENETAIVIGFGTSELQSKSTKRFCKWNGPFFGNCLGENVGRLKHNQLDNTDDTTVEFSFSELK